ncbi:HAD family hydrolase [candidate division KSB1 bacterium]
MIPLYPVTKGLIFDCDGTLVDSMPIHMEAWKKAFAEFGENCSDEFLNPLKGMHEEEIVDLYNKRYQKNINSRKLVDQKHLYFREKVDTVQPIKPVVALAESCRNKIPMAVVSGGREKNVIRSLEIIGINDLFQVILTADDPIKPKPAPDIFLEAARRIGVEPRLCQVFEDGDIGLEAARTAGMEVTDIRQYI